MRYLERSILLQVIDNRWREHLYDKQDRTSTGKKKKNVLL